MIEIQNKDLFGKVIAEALVKIDGNGTLQAWQKKRWFDAVARAVVLIEEQPEFMEFHPELNMLTVWNQDTNKVYNANGVCECRAGTLGQPCKHRAAKQLIKSYLAAESQPQPVEVAPATPASVSAKEMINAPYLRNDSGYKPQKVGSCRI